MSQSPETPAYFRAVFITSAECRSVGMVLQKRTADIGGIDQRLVIVSQMTDLFEVGVWQIKNIDLMLAAFIFQFFPKQIHLSGDFFYQVPLAFRKSDPFAAISAIFARHPVSFCLITSV